MTFIYALTAKVETWFSRGMTTISLVETSRRVVPETYYMVDINAEPRLRYCTLCTQHVSPIGKNGFGRKCRATYSKDVMRRTWVSRSVRCGQIGINAVLITYCKYVYILLLNKPFEVCCTRYFGREGRTYVPCNRSEPR